MIHTQAKVGLITARSGRVLLCRKRGLTSVLILPGGKPLPNEMPLVCLERELREELGSSVSVSAPTFVANYRHRAAHADPSVESMIEIALFSGQLIGTPQPAAEIQELVWFGADDDWGSLAPSLRESIFPDLIGRGLLDWQRRT